MDEPGLIAGPSTEEGRDLGMVIGGSLSQGLDVRLTSPSAVEEAKVGTFVTVQGTLNRFFGIITDLSLESSDSRLASSIGSADPAMAEVLAGTGAFAQARITPMLTTGIADAVPQPARSLPAHFAPVRRASNDDVQAVFGTEDDRHVYIGSPLDMEDTRVCLDLGELVKRSNGVFGKSGSGKSFLTRILLASILQRNVATNLVFDMHSEYGWQGTSETGYAAKGLKQMFGNRVSVFSLDPESDLRRGLSPDVEVRIGLDEIEPEDIATLAGTLNITEAGVNACFTLADRYRRQWISSFLSLDQDGMASLAAEGEHAGALGALRRKLRDLERIGFVQAQAPSGGGAVRSVLDHLTDGKHVVMEFGRYGDDLTAYLLVTNLITRRIHDEYHKQTEQALATGGKPPAPLVITIEEAHRFLGKGIAGQTIFGTIAREMRKYHVTLLVVDQRPSGIDDEVLSQIGTRITCQLDNDGDVDAVLRGAPGSRELRGVLSRLESQQQALIFGHALPMPVVVHTRDYDEFAAEMVLPGRGRAGVGAGDKADLFG
jgi:DNA helicase HerA-like ATPase